MTSGDQRDQLRRVSADFIGIGRGPVDVDAHIAADAPAQQRQLLLERPDARLKYRIVRSCGQKHPNATHLLALLRAGG